MTQGPSRMALLVAALSANGCAVQLDAGSDNALVTDTETVAEVVSGPSTDLTTLDAGTNDGTPTEQPSDDAGAPAFPDASEVPTALPNQPGGNVILLNDSGFDNWMGEFAVALAGSGAIQLAAIVVNTSASFNDLEQNVAAHQGLVDAARSSGIASLPDPIASNNVTLERPPSGLIEDTIFTETSGSRRIVEVVTAQGSESNPVTIVTGGSHSDVANAYLMDARVGAWSVVISQLGGRAGENATLGNPNGHLDPWATQIVARSFRYVQANAYGAQTEEVPASRSGDLPDNELGTWMANKIDFILPPIVAGDQQTVKVAAFPELATQVVRMAFNTDDTSPSTLVPDPDGNAWHLQGANFEAADAAFWNALNSPDTYSP